MKAAGGLRSAGTFPSVKPYSKPFNRNIMKQKKIRRQPQKKPSPRQQKPRKREDGRPQGTLKRFPFDETRIGFMLRYEMPVVYHLLRRLCATQQPFEPDWQVIRSVAEASKDPSCGKAKFRRYLDEYRRGRGLLPARETGSRRSAKPTMKHMPPQERRVYPPEPQEAACRSAERAGRRQTARGD